MHNPLKAKNDERFFYRDEKKKAFNVEEWWELEPRNDEEKIREIEKTLSRGPYWIEPEIPEKNKEEEYLACLKRMKNYYLKSIENEAVWEAIKAKNKFYKKKEKELRFFSKGIKKFENAKQQTSEESQSSS